MHGTNKIMSREAGCGQMLSLQQQTLGMQTAPHTCDAGGATASLAAASGHTCVMPLPPATVAGTVVTPAGAVLGRTPRVVDGVFFAAIAAASACATTADYTTRMPARRSSSSVA